MPEGPDLLIKEVSMKSLFLAVAVVSMFLVSNVNATPCFVISDSYSEAYEKARAVFIGEVVKVEPFTSEVRNHMEIVRYRVTFKVEYSWKGAGFQEIGLPQLVVISEQVVKSTYLPSDCFPSPSFFEGKKYLVYANETEDKNLMVGRGNASKPLLAASDDLKEIKKRDGLFAHLRPRFLKLVSLRY